MADARFQVDLLHPGWGAQSWRDGFTGARGARRLALFAVVAAAVLLAVLVGGVLPTSWRLSADRAATPALARELSARDADLGAQRAVLQALSPEARRQVRWADLLAALSREIPPAVKLSLVEMGRPAPAAPGPGTAATPPRPGEAVLRIDALTPARPGGPALTDAARLVAALTRDPAVSGRFAVKSWESRPAAIRAAGGEPLLTISIVLSERAP